MHTSTQPGDLLRFVFAGAFLLGGLALPPQGTRAQAGTSLPPAPASLLQPAPRMWAEAAAGNEEHIVNFDPSAALRYRIRRRDAKGETVREVMESKEGTVARLLEHNGQPLTVAEDSDDRQRLQDILTSPDAFFRRVHRDEGSRAYASELLHEMPRAMQWSYAPGQPQLPGASLRSVVLDFTPDPGYRPPSLVAEGLTGIAGRVWVDPASRCVLRIQGTVLHPVDFGWGGVLARVKQGGSVVLEQHQASNRRWLYSHLVEHLSIREVLIHTVEENTELWASDVQPQPRVLSYREAIQQLLAIPVPTR